jgi:hypothetical protein
MMSNAGTTAACRLEDVEVARNMRPYPASFRVGFLFSLGPLAISACSQTRLPQYCHHQRTRKAGGFSGRLSLGNQLTPAHISIDIAAASIPIGHPQ